MVASVGEVEGAGGVEGQVGMPGGLAVLQDGVGVAEVLDAAQFDRVAVVFAEVAGEVAVGAAPADW